MADFRDVEAFLTHRKDLRSGEGATEDDISNIVSVWGELPIDYEQYLREFGWVAFGPHELLGIGLSTPAHLDLVTWARERWSAGLDKKLLPVYESGGDWAYCLNREGRVVCVDFDGSIDIEDHLSWSDWFVQMFVVDRQ